MTDPRHDCRHGHALTLLSEATFRALTDRHREWPGEGAIGDCLICGTTLLLPVERDCEEAA